MKTKSATLSQTKSNVLKVSILATLAALFVIALPSFSQAQTAAELEQRCERRPFQQQLPTAPSVALELQGGARGGGGSVCVHALSCREGHRSLHLQTCMRQRMDNASRFAAAPEKFDTLAFNRGSDPLRSRAIPPARRTRIASNAVQPDLCRETQVDFQ